MHIAFLGLGQMGSVIARHLAKIGYDLTVWNRTASAAEPVVALGAKAASSPSEAVSNATIVFTMLHDDKAHEEVLFASGALDAIPNGATHIALSTISVALSQKLEAEHAQRGQRYVASPVFGRPNVAAEGKLWLAIAGATPVVEDVLPVLAAFSRGNTVVGEKPAMAHALKLGGNFLITAMLASLSEAITFAESEGMEGELFLEAVNSALFQSPFYANYGKVMLHPPQTPGATVALGIKDLNLFREAAKQAGSRTPLADSFTKHMQAAADAGLQNDDWASGYLKHTRNLNTQKEKQ